MNTYLDSSVLLRIVLKQNDPLKEWKQYENRIGSQLVEVECLRTLDRMRVTGEFPERDMLTYREDLFQILETMEMVQPTYPILRRASETFPMALGTLDAIHLATALAWSESLGTGLIFATHDQTLAKAAKAFGLKTVGV